MKPLLRRFFQVISQLLITMMILLLIEKIRKTGNPAFIPLLKAWQEIDYKKVRVAIQGVINYPEKYKSV